VKNINLFRWILFGLFLSFNVTSIAGSYKSETDSNEVQFSYKKKVWFDGNRKRVVWESLNEIAIIPKKNIYKSKYDLIRDLKIEFPKAVVFSSSISNVLIRLPGSFSDYKQLQDFINKKNTENKNWIITNVYRNSPELSNSVFLSSGGVIVHFYDEVKKYEIKKWIKSNKFKVLKDIKNSHAVLLKCFSNETCIDDANRVRKQKLVKFAYPNWIRPRIQKVNTKFYFGDDIDLSVSQNITPNPVILEGELNISIMVHVLTGTFVINIHIKDFLPDGFVLKKATVQGGNCLIGDYIDCTVDIVSSLQKRLTVNIIAIPQVIGDFINKVSVESDGKDINLRNNISTANIKVSESNLLWNDPLFEQQWHFYNTGQGGGVPGVDVNILPVWQQDIIGRSVLIGIVDDGLEINHEDLKSNIVQGLSWDYVDNDNDPTAQFHGTSVAGIVAATTNNLIGVAGAAPGAQLFGLRLLGANTDINESEALSYRLDITDMFNNSWGPPDEGRGLFGPSALTEDAILTGVTEGRDGKGVIYCWAAGNGGDHDNSNYDGYANSPYTLTFTASTNEGKRAYYAEKGANILANVPSSGGTLDITTTDRTGLDGLDSGNYTDKFGGTSAASPLACGTIALLLELNPDLSWRDAQAIIATTAVKNDPGDSDWTVNGAGLHINHKYGFGRINADAAIEAAKSWVTLEKLQEISVNSFPNITIPDNDSTGVSSVIQINDDLSVEFVEVIFSAKDHPYWGDLEIRLKSPYGTESVLAEKHRSGRNTAHYDQWRFSSLRHLGELAQGSWELIVRDLATGDIGTFESWELKIYGTGDQNNQLSSDLSIEVQDSPDPVKKGERLVYNITVTNNGPKKATGILLKDTLPSEVQFLSIETTQGICAGSNELSCELGVLSAGGKINLKLNVLTLVAASVVTNKIEVHANEIDPLLENNIVNVETKILGNTVYTVSISTNGMVISEPEGINCPSNCSASFAEGENLILKEVSGHRFIIWSGNVHCINNKNSCKFEITKDINLRVTVM